MKSTLDTIAFFKNIRGTLDAMPDADAGALIKALFAHDDGEEVDLRNASPIVRATYPLVVEGLDRLTQVRMSKVRPQNNRKPTANAPQNNRKPTANAPQNNRIPPYLNHNHNLSPIGEIRTRDKKTDYEGITRDLFVASVKEGS